MVHRDASVVSAGFYYVTYGRAGFHSGGAGVDCYDPQQDLDCDYASAHDGSTDVGYVNLQEMGDRVQVCGYGGVFGYGCDRLL